MSDLKAFRAGQSILCATRVTNPLPIPEICCYCGSKIEVRHHLDHYGKIYSSNWPWLYCCTQCGASTGMHPRTAIPVGILADSQTRAARSSCKGPFTRLYESGRISRRRAYRLLAAKLGVEVDKCHFGWFDAETCYRAVAACAEIERDLDEEQARLAEAILNSEG